MNICQFPVQNKLASAARPVPCGQIADIPTRINQQVFDKGKLPQITVNMCLKHSIQIGINRLAQSLFKSLTKEELELLEEKTGVPSKDWIPAHLIET